MTCVMFCLKSKPAFPCPVADHGPPNPMAGEVIVIAGPVPESELAAELWWRCAYCTRNSFNLLDPAEVTSCPPVESRGGRKWVARSRVRGIPLRVPPPLL